MVYQHYYTSHDIHVYINMNHLPVRRSFFVQLEPSFIPSDFYGMEVSEAGDMWKGLSS